MNPIAGSVAPNVPLRAIFDVALRAKDEFVGVVGLVNVKLKGLWRSGIGDVEIQIVSEILNGIVAAKLLPPQSVRVRRAAAKIELGRSTVKRGRKYVFRHGIHG